jgi:hypothetical protein
LPKRESSGQTFWQKSGFREGGGIVKQQKKMPKKKIVKQQRKIQKRRLKMVQTQKKQGMPNLWKWKAAEMAMSRLHIRVRAGNQLELSNPGNTLQASKRARSIGMK